MSAVTTGCEHRYRVRVYIENTDSFGMVHHTQYINFLERARSEWLRELGYSLSECTSQGILFVIHSLNVQYHKPVYLDDELEIVSRIAKSHRVSLDYQQWVYHTQSPEQAVCTGMIRVVCTDLNLKPQKLPAALIRGLTGND